MGIYDRDYYRREGPSFLGSLAEQGRVTTWLIGINVVCFLAQMLTIKTDPVTRIGVSPFTDLLILDVNLVLQGQVWRLITYAFLHDTGQILHIVFNMLMLFWFGRLVEETIGGREYLWFYLIGGILAGIGFVVACKLNLHPTFLGVSGRCLGASGAVTAVLIVAACIDPRQIIYMFLLIPVPIWLFVVLNVAMDTFGLLTASNARVATSAHLAGAAFGFCYYKLGWHVSGWTRWLTGWSSMGRNRPKLRVYREEEETPTPRTPPVAPTRLIDDEKLEAQVDTILEKIARVGMEGLSEQEKQVLMRASEAIKRRRG
jgi:membrane associated rhomboid family serine protease